jgi:hypothetical protein
VQDIVRVLARLIEGYGVAPYGDQAQAVAALAQVAGSLFQALAAVAAVVTLLFIYFQVKREGLRHSADLIINLREHFNSGEMRKMRKNSAKDLRSGDLSSDLPELLNFLTGWDSLLAVVLSTRR